MNTDQKSIMQFLSAQAAPVMADTFLAKWPSGPDSGYHALAVLKERGFVQLAPGRPGHRGWELTDEGRNYRETRMAAAFGGLVQTRLSEGSASARPMLAQRLKELHGNDDSTEGDRLPPTERGRSGADE